MSSVLDVEHVGCAFAKHSVHCEMSIHQLVAYVLRGCLTATRSMIVIACRRRLLTVYHAVMQSLSSN